MPVKLDCEHCGEGFSVASSRKNTAKYCSRDCMWESKRVLLHCEECDKKFQIRKSEVRTYCSTQCARSARTKNVTIVISCEYCEEDFQILRHKLKEGRKYCSKDCFYKSSRNRKTTNCEYCDQLFGYPASQENRKFCSSECFNKSKENKVKKVCEYCEKNFKIFMWKEKLRGQKFCSQECFGKASRELIILQCEQCEKDFKVRPCEVRKFCSHECYSDSRRDVRWASTEEECPTCHEIFFAKESKPQTYCSKECYLEHIGHDPDSNEYRYYGPNWLSQRRKVIKRDNETCQECGGEGVDVHHIKPFRLFDEYKAANRLSNLVLLCRSCHTKTDSEIRHSEEPNRVIKSHYQKFIGSRK